MKYRDHRATLVESMKTEIEVSSKQDIIDHLNNGSAIKEHIVVEIKFKPLGIIDKRTGWNTSYVLQRIKGEDNFTICGSSDGILEI